MSDQEMSAPSGADGAIGEVQHTRGPVQDHEADS